MVNFAAIEHQNWYGSVLDPICQCIGSHMSEKKLWSDWGHNVDIMAIFMAVLWLR